MKDYPTIQCQIFSSKCWTERHFIVNSKLPITKTPVNYPTSLKQEMITRKTSIYKTKRKKGSFLTTKLNFEDIHEVGQKADIGKWLPFPMLNCWYSNATYL